MNRCSPDAYQGPISGYGVGNYGVGAYGAGTPESVYLANGWTLDAYGISTARGADGDRFMFRSISGRSRVSVTERAASVLAVFVTPERFVVALASMAIRLKWRGAIRTIT